jgi:hypothetical protein
VGARSVPATIRLRASAYPTTNGGTTTISRANVTSSPTRYSSVKRPIRPTSAMKIVVAPARAPARTHDSTGIA